MEKKREGVSIVRESGVPVLYVQAAGVDAPSLELDGVVMGGVVDVLREHPDVQRVVFLHQRNYVYDEGQTGLLKEVAQLFGYLAEQQEILQLRKLVFPPGWEQLREFWRLQLRGFLGKVKSDPVGCYVEIQRVMRKERIKIKHAGAVEAGLRAEYVEILGYLLQALGGLKLMQRVKEHTSGYRVGSREIYSRIFQPLITPEFLFSRLQMHVPVEAEQVDRYQLEDGEVTIFRLPGRAGLLYHVMPREFLLDDEKYQLLNVARGMLAKHRPSNQEFLQPEKMRETFFHIGQGLLRELASARGVMLSYHELRLLADILVRYTVGFGLLEVLLADKKVQDVVINGPVGESCVFIVHQEYDECSTNILPAAEEGESWATKFRIMSGRPLDEANPVLDTELLLRKARARVSVMGKPLSPAGLAFAFRRHRDEPWTFPLFMQNKMMNGLAAGLLSFVIDGGRSLLFAGTRGSGKTSLLGASMVEILKRHRVIVLEDTQELPLVAMRGLGYNIQGMKVRGALMHGGVELAADEGIRTSLRFGDSCLIVGEIRSSLRGNEKVVIVEGGKTKRIPIQDLEHVDTSNIYVPTLGFDLKVKMSRLTGFVKHPKRTTLLRIKTRTGREVTVTPDHSLFTSHNFKIFPVECKELRKGSKIVLPGRLPSGYRDVGYINLLEYLEDARVENFEPPVRGVIEKIGWKKATEICGIQHGDIYNYFRSNQKTNIPVSSFNKLIAASQQEMCLEMLRIKNGTSNTLQALFPINEDFCRFLGYFISEGYYSQSSLKISNDNDQIIADVVSLCKNLFGIKPYIRETHGLGRSRQICISNSPLVKLVARLGCGRTSKEKGIPALLYGLSESKIYAFLSGLYAGDGGFTSSKSSGNCVRYFTTSQKLADDLTYLLLHVGIVGRLLKGKQRSLSGNPVYIVEFKEERFVKRFLEHVDFVKYQPAFIQKKVSHSSLNDVSYDIEELEKHLKLIRKYRHLRKYHSCGKEFLRKIVEDDATEADLFIKNFAHGDFYLDEVREIEEIALDEGEYVYDLSVEPSQNFVGGTGGVLLHNTEARALYEAMRIGALANVVAGTIHGGDAYSVFDRVVNDLNVPRTSFKATDLIIVANPVKTADGLSRKRRIISITEVRKGWEDDPVREKGFVELMRYDSRRDELMPTAELVQGESEILKMIAGGVMEWAGDWDAVWGNIQLRAAVRELLLRKAEQYRLPEMLEAGFVAVSNDVFHVLCEESREKNGGIENAYVLRELEEWMEKQVKRKAA